MPEKFEGWTNGERAAYVSGTEDARQKLAVPDLDEAVRAFLNLDAWQLPKFCEELAKKGVFVNVNVSPFSTTQAGYPMAQVEIDE